MNAAPRPNRVKNVMVDEFSRVLRNHDDQLIEALRAVEGIPDAAYRVDGSKVFVFSKLVQLVKERLSTHPDAPLEELARSLVPEASVTAQEAIASWRILPEPYEVSSTPENGSRILHRPFNATLPERFEDQVALNEALAKLLLGGVVPGSGDFSYKGQPMSLRASLDIAQLPPRPKFPSGHKAPENIFTVLSGIDYEPGFEPVQAALFNDVKTLEAEWARDSSAAGCYAQEHYSEVWARTADLRLESLNSRVGRAFDTESLGELRALYPELPMLTDDSLLEWFDSFQTDICLTRGWEPSRNDDFLFYLYGMAVSDQDDADEAVRVGHWMACALLHGSDTEEALAFGLSVTAFATELSRLAARIAAAMRFLVDEKTTPPLQGRRISTLGDLFRQSRKYSASSILAQQAIAKQPASEVASKAHHDVQAPDL